MIASNLYSNKYLATQELKDRIDLRDVVESFWGPGKREGKGVRYASPWRDDGRKPSLMVYANGYKDYGGSGECGDIFDWLQCEGIASDFLSAFQWAAAYADGSLHRLNFPVVSQRSQPPQPQSILPEWQEAALHEAEEAQRYLWSNRKEARRALNYLRQIRWLEDETIRKYKLGYNPQWKKTRYRNPQTGKWIWLQPGLTIPVNMNGELCALRIRCRVGNLADWMGIDPDQFTYGERAGEELPKYMNMPGSRLSGVLFNQDKIVDGQDVLITEGEFDAMLADQTLNVNREEPIAVVTFGSATNHPSQQSLGILNQTGRVWLALDSDTAGQEATRRLFDALQDKCCVVTLPEGKDVTEFVVDHTGNLSELLESYSHPCWWSSGVPDSMRSALLSYMPPSAAPVVELLNTSFRQGRLSKEGFDIPTLNEAAETLGYDIPERTLRSTIQSLDGLFLQKLETENTPEEASNFCNNSTRGRKPTRYMAMTVEFIQKRLIERASKRIYEREHPVEDKPVLPLFTPDMMKAAEVDLGQLNAVSREANRKLEPAYREQEHYERLTKKRAARKVVAVMDSLNKLWSTPLPASWPINSAGEYRAAYFHALVKANPDIRRPRRWIMDTLGVANGSISALVERAGLEAEAQHEIVQVILGSNPQQAIQQKGYKIGGYGIKAIFPDSTGESQEVYLGDPSSWQRIANLRYKGTPISIKFQMPNLYRVASETPYLIKTRKGDSQKNKAEQHIQRARRSTIPAYYGPGYNPHWVRKHLEYGFSLLGWEQRGRKFIQSDTGEVFQAETSVELLELLVGSDLLKPQSTQPGATSSDNMQSIQALSEVIPVF